CLRMFAIRLNTLRGIFPTPSRSVAEERSGLSTNFHALERLSPTVKAGCATALSHPHCAEKAMTWSSLRAHIRVGLLCRETCRLLKLSTDHPQLNRSHTRNPSHDSAAAP